MTTPTTVLFGLTRVGTIQPWQGRNWELRPDRTGPTHRRAPRTKRVFRYLPSPSPIRTGPVLLYLWTSLLSSKYA